MTAFTADATSDVITATAHGLEVGDAVVVSSDGTPPAPLVAGRLYYVLTAPDADTLTLARGQLPDEDTVDITDAGSGAHALELARASAVDHLYEAIAWWFEARDREEVVLFGRRTATMAAQAASGRAGRVCIVPGDDAGKAGKLGAAKGMRGPSGRRSIYSLDELITIRVWGADSSQPSDERAQYRAVWNLYEDVMRAIRGARCGRISLGDPSWVTTPVELIYGAELVMQVMVESRIEDEPALVAQIDERTMPVSLVTGVAGSTGEVIETYSTVEPPP